MPAVPLRPLSGLLPLELADCFALLARKQSATTRTGRSYFTCQFRDAGRLLPAMIWPESPWFAACDADWQEGDALRLRVKLIVHEQYGPQLEIHDWRRPTPADVAAGCVAARLIAASRFDLNAMWSELVALVDQEISQPAVKKLVLGILSRRREVLLELPASDGRFHPFRGGWLEHTLSLLKSVLLLTDYYLRHYAGVQPALDRDLVAAAAVLHDVGRAAEWRPGPTGTPIPTVPGRLFGHLLLGRDIVRDAALAQGDVPGPWREKLEHLVLTHLALPEWGSPRLPLLPEALILHHADDLDAKLEMYLRLLSRDETPGDVTTRDGGLNRALLKATHWTPHDPPPPPAQAG
jgi:3'-5' exoribonuclease